MSEAIKKHSYQKRVNIEGGLSPSNLLVGNHLTCVFGSFKTELINSYIVYIK